MRPVRFAGFSLLLTPVMSGCTIRGRAPSFVVFGSYFPAWIVCALAGLALAIAIRAVFLRVGIDEFLPVRLLVYISLGVLCALLIWLVVFTGAG